MERIDVMSLASRLGTEADAYAFLEELRWNGQPECPHCASTRAYFLNPANGVSRKTRTGAASERRVWKCAECRKQFSALTGTIFHGSKISVRIWLFVLFEMCCSKNGVSAREVQRKYGLTAKSAWFMTHRIREAMKLEPLAGMLRGTVVADEAFVGGKPGNMHASKRAALRPEGEYVPKKVAILSLIDTATGEVRSQVVRDVTGATLRKAMASHVDFANTTLHTDAAASYRSFSSEFASHQSVNHEQGEYVRDGVSTNKAENFFSQLKRSLDGTHHKVSREHLHRYLAEFDYRYSTRKLSDTERTRKLVKQVGGRRLTYRPLTARA